MTITSENWKDHWEEVKVAISGVKNQLVQKGEIEPEFAYWQAVYTVASTINVSAVELWLEINKEKEKSMQDQFAYELVDAAEVPRVTSKTKWDALRYVIFNVLKVNGQALKKRFPNKREAQLGSSAAQNTIWTETKATNPKRSGHLMPKGVAMITRTAPVDKDHPDGDWYLWVKLIRRQDL